ncbi:hypothetical protein CANARDRAFT_196117 [[Candida] arabinofermentans NRRL YB-2248]|uniref:GrpE protein homolog n=1 Tax=[Candida] arabinofermentans NRRL YB-2248 TaxID=983967 RepID=A0A1E4T4S0_9ASCO|nr:hypothetical protein CANARDRAFT_196117 [[Candida] arabinofermentans NRRL YB-2248]
MQRSLLRLSKSAVRPAGRSLVFQANATPLFRTFTSTSRFLNEKKESSSPESSAEPVSEETPVEKELKELKEKLVAKDKEVAEFKDRYLRSVADFRNLQETTKREIQKAKDFALQKFAKDLIESIDNFGHALSAVKDDTLKTNVEVSQLYDGVKMTRDIFEKTLSRHGLTKIDPLDEPFDPNRHEATFQAPSPDKEPGTVMFVQQPGFELNGRVLRAAKVGIVKSDEEN